MAGTAKGTDSAQVAVVRREQSAVYAATAQVASP